MNTNCDKIPLDIKNGEVIMKRILKLLLILTVLFSNISICKLDTYAADGTVNIFLGDSSEPRHHISLNISDVTETISYEVEGGKRVKQSDYSAGDFGSGKACFEVVDEKSGKCKLKGLLEGTGVLKLNITTESGEKLEEKVFISVCFKYNENIKGKALKNTGVYRGASDKTNMENPDLKGSLANNSEVTVLKKCLNYYYIKNDWGTKYEDGLDVGFVKAEDIDINIDLKVEPKEITVKQGEYIDLTNYIKISPKEIFGYTLNYKIRNNKYVDYDEDNKIEALRAGKTYIDIFMSYRGKKLSATLTVNVTNEISKDIVGNFKVDGEAGYNLNFVKYTKSARANEYLIQEKKKGKWKTVYEFYGTKAPGLKVRLVNKKPDKKYWYRVVARKVTYVVNGANDYKVLDSKPSKKFSIKTASLKVKKTVSGKTVSLKWNKLASSKKYDIYYEVTQKKGKKKEVKRVKKAKYKKKLKKGKYSFSIRACYKKGKKYKGKAEATKVKVVVK